MSRAALRVGLVCPYSLDVPGGVQAHVLGLAEQLARRLTPATTPAPLSGVVAHALALVGARTA